MKARPSRSRSRAPRGDLAQVGIGTMIVFIATILVSAVAAAVLIDTSGFLQERATQTGKETTQAVATNLMVKDVIGKRTSSGSSDPLTSLEIHVSLAPGAQELDLEQTVLLLGNSTDLLTLTYDEADGADLYTALDLRDADGSYTVETPVMTPGDLVRITISLGASTNDLSILPREHVMLRLIPEVGSEVGADFDTPFSFGSALVLKLR